MPRPKKIEKPRRISIVVEEDFLFHLEKIARSQAKTLAKNLPVSQLIRETLEQTFPIKKDEQRSLF